CAARLVAIVLLPAPPFELATRTLSMTPPPVCKVSPRVHRRRAVAKRARPPAWRRGSVTRGLPVLATLGSARVDTGARIARDRLVATIRPVRVAHRVALLHQATHGSVI